jgi:hypothetical protein
MQMSLQRCVLSRVFYAAFIDDFQLQTLLSGSSTPGTVGH